MYREREKESVVTGSDKMGDGGWKVSDTQQAELMSWLAQNLESLSDASPDALSKYIAALVVKEKPNRARLVSVTKTEM